MFSNFLATVVDIVWGVPLVILLIGGGLYLIAISKMQILLGTKHAVSLLFQSKNSEGIDAPGQLSHFRSLSNALAATVGMGNIAGVAVAITQGGAGAVFWMWVTAFIGMNTKFFECTVALMYRGKDYLGEVQGGAMYVIDNALPRYCRPLSLMFAICGLLGTLAIFNANQITHLIVDSLGPSFGVNLEDTKSNFLASATVGLILGGVVFYILRGGLKRLSDANERIVPLMCVVYVVSCLVILFQNLSAIPEVFAAIFKEALGFNAVAGGASGAALRSIMIIGVKRAAFSNEAGMGSAPLAHSNAKTKEPVSEGLVAMLGPFLDTIIVCTMTALVILIMVPESIGQTGIAGIAVTKIAFERAFSSFGIYLLLFVSFLFSFSSLVGFANYNQKCWNYLFKGRYFFGVNGFAVFYCSTVVLGAVAHLNDVINLLDIGFALMAIPNMIATIYLAPKVRALARDYFKRKLHI